MSGASRRLRGRAAVVAGCVALAALAGCTGHSSPDSSASTTSSTAVAGLGGNAPHPAPTTSGDQQQAASGPLAQALATVPASVLYASYANLDSIRRRLGFEDVTSASPAGRRFEFWEAARADGAMLTGTRLYDFESLMEQDYGWTADDISWEIDFSGDETGCSEDMLCDPSGGAVLSLRRSLDFRVVLGSLQANGFRLEGPGQTYVTDKQGQPFNRALVIPQLNALVIGNAIGLVRVNEVLGGATSAAERLATLTPALGEPESAYLATTGCVSLGEAFGPDATADDVDAYYRHNDPSRLADSTAWAVAIDSARSATAAVALRGGHVDAAAEVARRTAVLDGWPGVQSGTKLADVATAKVSVDGDLEQAVFDVAAMPTFSAMVLSHDAPWALCPATAPS